MISHTQFRVHGSSASGDVIDIRQDHRVEWSCELWVGVPDSILPP